MSRKRRVAVIDAETDPFLFGRAPKPFIWGFFDGESFRHFDRTEDLVAFLRGQRLVVYAHNGGRFDYEFFRDFFEPYRQVRIINGRTAAFNIGKCIFRDSLLILPVRLKDFKKEAFDYVNMEAGRRDIPEVRAQIEKYLESDCRNLYELVTAFRGKYGGHLTLATAGINFWKGQSGVKVPKTPPVFYDEFKPYYHGGRVTAFRHGIFKGRFFVYDIRSAYPFAMANFHHPWGIAGSTWDGMLPPEKEIGPSFIDLEADASGVFCVVEKDPVTKRTRMEFPTDGKRRVFHITGWEYLAARDTGFLKNPRIIRTKTFHERINFREYIEHFYLLKKESTKGTPDYIFAKLFMNSLYGKFAADPSRYKTYAFVPAADLPIIEADQHARYYGFRFESEIRPDLVLISRELLENERRYYNVATAASITGFVRSHLWRALVRAKNPFYCDTDSIIAEGFDGKIGKGLGDWAVEFEGRRLAIAGRKLYAVHDGKTRWGKFDPETGEPIGWKTAHKGVDISGPTIFDIARGKEIVYQKPSPSMSLISGVNFIERTVRRVL